MHQAMPRDALLSSVKGANGLLCTVTEKIDREVLDAAGKATITQISSLHHMN